MALPFLAAVDLSSQSPPAGLSDEDLSRLGNVYLIATPETVDESIAYVFSNSKFFSVSVNAAALGNDDALVTSLLDAGAARVFVNHAQLKALHGTVEDSRLVLLVDHGVQTKEKMIDAIAGTSVGVYAHQVTDIDFITGWLQEYGVENRPPVFVSFGIPLTAAVATAIGKLAATPIIPRQALTTDPEKNPGLLSAAEVFLAGIRSDREDRLIATVVVDEQGVALGLVYSSPESVSESLRTGTGVYQSRKRGLWHKGATSGAIQELVGIHADCDQDCLRFSVRQKGAGFCHLQTATCFGKYTGLPKLQRTLQSRKESAPAGSYTARLFSDERLLRAKIMEEAEELCDATTKEDIAFEAADLMYFALAKCVGAGVSLADVERSLDAKSLKVRRRQGDAKGQWAEKQGITADPSNVGAEGAGIVPGTALAEPVERETGGRIEMKRFDASAATPAQLEEVLRRPAQKTNDIMGIVAPIIEDVKARGDAALLELAAKFDRASGLESPVIRAPFPPELMQLDAATVEAIDISFENIRRFHAGQKEDKPLVVETMPGVRCSRFVRAIERVGCYIPGGTAVLPSTALMLGVPALVAGCKKIVFASPPRPDGSITPEIVYVAHKVGAEAIVLAGGAQAVAALAYGTESVPKVDKILGPGNQFVTAAKMLVSNDTGAGVSIDMPAGPSEVLVVADSDANPAFVASDLLSQAEHGVDSQVVLVAVGLADAQLRAIEDQVHSQAVALPRVDIVRGAIGHSVTLRARDIEEAMRLSNLYAPEHLILQVRNASAAVDLVEHAGSVFVGPWTPESVGDYSAGVNHSLPTYGYARQYSGVNLSTYLKHITSSELTEQGLRNVGPAVMRLAEVEELEAHRRAVEIRLDYADGWVDLVRGPRKR